MFHYGYDGVGEALTETDIFIEDVVNAAISYLDSIIHPQGAALAPYLALPKLLIGEVMHGAKFLTGYGPSTENKYEVSFPDYGFNHAYGFGTDEILVEQQPASITNLDVGNPYFLVGGAVLTLLLLRRLL